MSTDGMPQRPNPPTDSDMPSVMPAMASWGEETTLSMARTLSAPTPMAAAGSPDPMQARVSRAHTPFHRPCA